MPTKSKSRTTTKKPRVTQSAFAIRLGVSFPRVNEVINAKRSVTPDIALQLAQVTRMSADFWLGLQQDWDSWHANRDHARAQFTRQSVLHQPRGERAEARHARLYADWARRRGDECRRKAQHRIRRAVESDALGAQEQRVVVRGFRRSIPYVSAKIETP